MKLYQVCILACLIGLRCSAQPPRNSSHKGKANRLINSQSPYLLQHAYNPVDWYPWGDEAQELANKEEKLMLISIGYAACHWCHVMERESFEDSTVAALMNEQYVSIKVDREERPDVDDIYMTACGLLSREGCGWPLNVITLPDGRPIFAGTYFPKNQWINILNRVQEVYQRTPEKAEDLATQLTAQLQTMQGVDVAEGKTIEEENWHKMATTLLETMDKKWGGRKGAPKFPMPNNLLFLLEYHAMTGNEEAKEMVLTTLDLMATQGLYDHLGGGFARYSTDAEWKVPHFEKMLYDNSQLVSLYSKAYQLTKKELYKQVVFETLAYVEREMTHPNGAFYSSLDADSEGEEGKFYVWTQKEIEEVLGKDAALFSEYFQLTEAGNWEEEKNILWRLPKADLIGLAKKYQMDTDEMEQSIQAAKELLFKERAKRVGPGLDDKQITAWNALMIKGYVDAYRVFGEKAFLETAQDKAQFILDNCREDSERLFRIFKDGKASINGFLDDYSFLSEALIALYEATFEEKWLHEARKLATYTIKHFGDENTEMFFYTSDLDDPLLTRSRKTDDNVIPGSNSSMARVLFLLGTYFYEEDWIAQSQTMLLRMKESALREPGFFSNWARLTMLHVKAPYEVAILGPEAQNFRSELDQRFLPHVFYLGGNNEGNLTLLENKLVEGATTIYVCTNKMCKLPVREVESAWRLIE